MNIKTISSELEKLLIKNKFKEDIEAEKDAIALAKRLNNIGNEPKIYTRDNEKIFMTVSNKSLNGYYTIDDKKVIEFTIEKRNNRYRFIFKDEDYNSKLNPMNRNVEIYSTITNAVSESNKIEKNYKSD